MDKGTPCTQEGGVKPSVAWWHDDKSGICLSFKYTGCGGNANRFTTIKNCEQHCKMPDRGACALGKKPAEDSNGEQLVCAGMREDKCPNGYQCKMMAFMGLCCPTKEEELFAREYEGVCKSGKPVKMDRGSGWMMTILGKSCDDQFCPEDAKCEQGKLFANCCK
uniref:Ani s 1 allergen n=2 Tax=Anisakis simplex complex TaxID=644710 RepID=L7V0K4_ANISI|nr:Ani s 1 allergen [Anisakis pegreffii]AGC60036.1 Ani s 1 allergen [Anisakis simplex]